MNCLSCKQWLPDPDDDDDDDSLVVTINKEGSGPTLHICEDCVQMIVLVGRDMGMDV